jgi:type IV secretory pathway VirB2 component (pilin)
LDRPFWIIYALVGLPILFVVRPWAWDQPLISRLAAVLLFPFATAIVVHCAVLAGSSVLFGGAAQRRKFWSFLIVIGVISAGMAAEWALSGFSDSRWATPFVASFAGVTLYGALSRKRANLPPDPTPAAASPHAMQETHRF